MPYATLEEDAAQSEAKRGRPKGAGLVFTDSPVSALMRLLSMNDEQFAAFTGATQPTVQRWRLGFRSPSVSDLARIVSLASKRIGRSISLEELNAASFRSRDNRSRREKNLPA